MIIFGWSIESIDFWMAHAAAGQETISHHHCHHTFWRATCLSSHRVLRRATDARFDRDTEDRSHMILVTCGQQMGDCLRALLWKSCCPHRWGSWTSSDRTHYQCVRKPVKSEFCEAASLNHPCSMSFSEYFAYSKLYTPVIWHIAGWKITSPSSRK